MRTNIDIDDKLMRAAMRATGSDTKKGTVEAAMRVAVQLHKQGQAVKKLRGLGWEGNLNEMRESRIAKPKKHPSRRSSKLRASAA